VCATSATSGGMCIVVVNGSVGLTHRTSGERYATRRGKLMTALREDRIQPDVFDDDDILLPLAERAPHGALRLPDGRAMAWAEYGSPRGLPCVLVPDIGSSRLAPGWLLHDSALPAAIRLLAMDRPGIGVSDPIGFGGDEDPAEDLRRLVETLAVGRVAVIGIGQGADDAFAFAARYPALVTSVSAVSVRLPEGGAERRGFLRPFARRHTKSWSGPQSSWIDTAGKGADLAAEVTWSRMLDRLDVVSAQVLGDRWREADFRDAVAADAAQINPAWTAPARPGGPPQWTVDPGSIRVPVNLWHGKHETGTTLAAVLAFADPLPRWTVHPATGSSAVLGSWTGILGAAAQSFPGVAAA
jgi:pimeloyl-ACP methyl ester carboxylesterase